MAMFVMRVTMRSLHATTFLITRYRLPEQAADHRFTFRRCRGAVLPARRGQLPIIKCRRVHQRRAEDEGRGPGRGLSDESLMDRAVRYSRCLQFCLWPTPPAISTQSYFLLF